MFGFHSWRDFFKTMSGLQYKGLAVWDIALSAQIALLSMHSFIDQWIWAPFYSLVIYFIVLGADFLSGVAVGMRVKKEGFITQKGQRLFIIFPVHLVLLGVLFNAGRINRDLGIQGIDDGVFMFAARAFYFYVLGINLISFMKNLVLLGLLKGQIASWFESYIDKHKNTPNDGSNY